MKNLFVRLTLAAALGSLFTSIQPVLAQGTAFTYQGQLNASGGPASGNYDFTFALFDNNSTNTGQAGATLTNLDVGVTNGLFIVTLDFGGVFTGANYWLAIGVRSNGGANFTALNPLQAVTPAPYAIYAPNAGSVAAANITGTIPLGVLPGAVVTNGESGVTLSGNGNGLTDLNLSSIGPAGTFSFTNAFPFSSSATYSVGAIPACVAAVDVNGDGKLDLISANSGGNTLTVLTNNGKGGFGFYATLAVGNYPCCVVAADVNGDGKVDLISANSGDNTLTVLTNNGKGGFGFYATLAVGNYPSCVVAADVNGDGKVDLISANSGDNTLTVLTNNGNGGFGFYATLAVGNGPSCVVAADVNGDGKVDLISANEFDNTLTVLTNNGNGGFGLYATLTVGNDPISVVAADVNGDGKVDLISANSGGNTLTVLINNGNGSFRLYATLTVGFEPSCVAAADVNGDGKVDLISANILDNTLTVLTNNGYGDFELYATLTVGNYPCCVVAADVNGDGTVDLISANFGDNTLTVLTAALGISSATPIMFSSGLNIFAGSFSGNGGGLTNLDATNLMGVIPVNNLPTNFSGSFSGNGGGLTNLNATNLTGVIPFNNLPANVAFLNSNQVFNGGLNSFTGNVGIGTTSPAAQAQISGNFSTNLSIGLALQGNGSGGSLMSFEQTGISSWGIGMVPNQSRLSIIDNRYPGNPGTEVMSVLTGGNVGIGTTNPSYALQVNGSVAGVGAYNNVSDARFKTNITRLTHALDKVMALQGVEYDWRSNAFPQMKFDNGKQLGFVAQEIKEVLPEVVSQDAQGYYSIAYSKVIPVLVEAIKDQQKEMENQQTTMNTELGKEMQEKDAEIEKLKAKADKVDSLEKQNDSLAARLNELEATVKALAEKK